MMNLALVVFLLSVGHPVFTKFVPLSVEDQSHGAELSKRTGNGQCYASGDPHYTTFDGKRYNFMGACRYVHTTDGCGKDAKGRPTLGTFKVIAENVNCGGSVSCVTAADILIGGESIHLQRGTTSPAPKQEPGYSVTYEGGYVVVRTKPAGLTVKWDMSTSLIIELDQQYRGKVCGLCGNFDGNTANDFTTSTGVVTNDVDAFGVSWQAGGKCGTPITPQHPCEKNPGRRADAEKDCAVIKSDAFSKCSAKMDVTPLYHNCVYDVCAETKTSMKESSCEAIREASTECKLKAGGENHVQWGHLAEKCRCLKTANVVGVGQKCCVFPFVFNGRQQFDCVHQSAGKPGTWCSTVADLDAVVGPIDQLVGICD